MKKLIYLISPIIVFIIGYFVVSFVTIELNSFNWSVDLRFKYVFFCIICSLLVNGFIYVNDDENYK